MSTYFEVAVSHFCPIRDGQSVEDYQIQLSQGMEILDPYDQFYDFAAEVQHRILKSAQMLRDLEKARPSTKIDSVEVYRIIGVTARSMHEDSYDYAMRYMTLLDVFLDLGGVMNGYLSTKWRALAHGAELNAKTLVETKILVSVVATFWIPKQRYVEYRNCCALGHHFQI